MDKLDLRAITVKRIKELSFHINEKLVKAETPFQSEIGLNFGYNADSNFIEIGLKIFFHYENSKEEIAAIVVQNVYEIPNLSSFLIDDKIILPQEVLVNLIGMSISHSRALFAVKTAGTGLNDALFPIAPAQDVSKHFFPYIFEMESKRE
jgi:hypothetical protein